MKYKIKECDRDTRNTAAGQPLIGRSYLVQAAAAQVAVDDVVAVG